MTAPSPRRLRSARARPASCATPAPGRRRPGGRPPPRRAAPAASAPRAPRSAAPAGAPRRSSTLTSLMLAGPFGGQLFQRGADHPAGPAPRRPEVHQHRDRGPLRDLGEVVVARVGDPRQEVVAVAALRHAVGHGGHPVALPAVRAGDDTRPRRRRGAHACAPDRARWVTTIWSPSTSTRSVEPSISPVAQQRAGDAGLHLAGDEPAQRPGTVDRVVARPRDEAAGLLTDLQRDVAVREPVAQLAEHQLDDVLDLAQGERGEQHRVVDPVEELGPEVSSAARPARGHGPRA